MRKKLKGEEKMKIRKVGLGKWKIEGIPELTFDSYWSARAYLLAL